MNYGIRIQRFYFADPRENEGNGLLFKLNSKRNGAQNHNKVVCDKGGIERLTNVPPYSAVEIHFQALPAIGVEEFVAYV